MYDFSSATREDLEGLVLKLDKCSMENFKRANSHASELLRLRKETDKQEEDLNALVKKYEQLEKAFNDACVELTKAYKKSGKTTAKWLKPESWATKFMKKDE